MSKTADSSSPSLETLVPEWLTFPDVAELLDRPVTAVHHMVSEGALVATKVGDPLVRRVPAAFIFEGRVLESLKGTVSVLRDAGYSDEEAIAWLFTEDQTLPGTPVEALQAGRKTEIRRRAQALAW